MVVAEMGIARGTFLIKRLEEAISAIEALPDDDRKATEIAKLENLRDRALTRIVGSAHGFCYLSLSTLEQDGRLEFPDGVETDRYREVCILISKYGLPDSFNSKLTDEVAVDLLEASVRDAEAWNYTKRLCANELQAGRQLHSLLLVFVGFSLVVPPKKGKVGRSSLKNAARNQFLSVVARQMQESFGLPLSRGVGSKSDSACSVLSETMIAFGLHMTEAAILKAIGTHEVATTANGNNSASNVSGD
jgi:hypothetical protein